MASWQGLSGGRRSRRRMRVRVCGHWGSEDECRDDKAVVLWMHGEVGAERYGVLVEVMRDVDTDWFWRGVGCF